MSIKNLEIKPSEAKAVEIASLPTRPTSSATYGGRGLTAQEMKKAYDAYPALIKERFNALIADLLSGIAISDIPFSVPSHEPFGENIEQTVKGFLDSVGAILDFGTDDARTIFGFVKQFVSDAAKATSLEYDNSTQLLTLTIDGEEKSVTIDFDKFDQFETAIAELRSTVQTLDEKKFDKSGGGITGDVNIGGSAYIGKDLTVAGNSIIQEAEHLQVKDAVIVMNKDGDILAVLSGLAIRKGANADGVDETYGIMYDPVSDSVKLGLVYQDESGNYQFLAGEGYPVATRADSSVMHDGMFAVWDAANRRFVTSDVNPSVVNGLPERIENAEGNIEILKAEVQDLGSNKLNKIKDTVSKQAADIELLYTLIENTIITNTTVEDTYTTRETAGGLSVVDEAPTTVHKITGASAASINLATVANQTIVSNGVTFIGSATDGTVQMTGSVTEENEYATATVTTGFYLPVGTYTLYAPHKADKVGWHVRNAQSTSIAELNWNGTTTAVSFTVSAAGSYHLYVLIPRGAGTLDYTETPMLLRGDRTANLPAFEPYYAGIKSAGFRGITSTGRNLIASLADKTVSADGTTAVANPSDGTVTINGRPTTAPFNANVSVDFYLPRGTYTIYAPHRTMRFAGWIVKSRKSGATVGKIDWASLGGVVSAIFTVTEPGIYYLNFFAPSGYDYPPFNNYVETPMILPGALKENFPAFETYHADTSFALTTPVTLEKWDYIDVDAKKLVTGTATLTQETPFTDEQLAQFDEYILSADGKTVAYRTAAPTETPLSLPKTYQAWHGGCEYITKDAAGGQNTDDLKLTVNQTYYEEVTA